MPLLEIRVQFPGEEYCRILRPDEIMTIPQASKQLGKFKSTLYRRIEAGKIFSIKLGGILFIPVSEVERCNKKDETGARDTPVS